MEPWLDLYTGDNLDGLLVLEHEYRIDSLVTALEQRISLKDTYSSAEELILSLCEFDREVNNGGFHQYLTNSSRQYAHRLASDLETIGLSKASQQVTMLLALTGLPASNLGEGCHDWLSNDFEDALQNFDDYYFAEVADCSDPLWAWIKLNQEQVKIG